jgi:NitT/TauT family transport system substrate-binding protein
MVCDSRVLADTQGREAVKKFVTGWMDGVKAARANPDSAVKALVDTEKMFTLIDKQEGAAFIKTLFNNVMWTGLEDNARILGIVGGTNHYERVYKQFDVIYRQAGALANPNSPVINPGDSIDYSFIKDMLDGDKTAVAAAKVEVNTFTEAGAAAAKTAAVTKPVMINFDSGIAVLTQRARKVIDTEMVPFIENNGSAYIELSGNADSVGAASSNRALSRQRAAAVGDYLVKQWDINPTRLKIAGNGSDKPLCNEGNPDGMTLEECRAANRTTRVGILK